MSFLSLPLAGWIQIAVFFGVLIALIGPVGRYVADVMEGNRVFLTPAMAPLEKAVYVLCGVDPAKEMRWGEYARALVLFTFASAFLLCAVLLFQPYPDIPFSMAFNVAASFVTNTCWQAYVPETTVTPFTQMFGLTVQNFVSPCLGLCVAVALARGFVRREEGTVGNFWADMVRGALYIFFPLCCVYALFLLSQGVPQSFGATASYPLLESRETASLSIGPVASQLAIKEIGTNGGGYYAASAAHPFENPTPLSNFAQMLAVFLLPASLTMSFGAIVREKRQGWALFFTMLAVLLPLAVFACVNEAGGNPLLTSLGVSDAAGNMEGKEVRFGAADSALWTAINGASSSGSSNASFDSMMPLTLLVPFSLMDTGQVIFGGVGSGLYGLLIYVLIAVFIASLMIGRSPEYLGKRIEGREIQLASLAVIVPSMLTLAGAAILSLAEKGTPHPHAQGFSQYLYAAAATANNNGSLLAGMSYDDPFSNIALGFLMLASRLAVMLCVLAIAGSLAAKNKSPTKVKGVETDAPLFVFMTICVILILSIPAFLPSLALGPIAEHIHLASLVQP